VWYAALKVTAEKYTASEARRLLGIRKKLRGKLIPPFRFSRDCRAVIWGNRHFKFSVRAAACIRYMRHRGWVAADEVLVHAADEYAAAFNSDAVATKLEGLAGTRRFRDLFKRSAAWGTMIVAHPKRKGLYRLAGPPGP
jgi:hypothetical protein